MSIFAGAISAFAATDASKSVSVRNKVSPYTSPSGETPVTATGSIGVRLNVITDFSGVFFKIATYQKDDLTADISVYKWEGSYAKSTDKEAVFTDTITLQDNKVQGISFDELMPAGDNSSGAFFTFITEFTSHNIQLH